MFWVKSGFPKLLSVHFTKTFITLLRSPNSAIFSIPSVKLLVCIEIIFVFIFCHLIKRWFCRIYMTMLNERSHKAEEEGEKKYSNMRSVNIGIGHTNDFVITKFVFIKFFTNSAAKSSNHRFDFSIFKHAVKSCLLNVQNFASKRQNGLESSVSSGFSCTARRIALYDVNFAETPVSFTAVSKLSRKGGIFKHTLSSCKLSCISCCLSCTLSHYAL